MDEDAYQKHSNILEGWGPRKGVDIQADKEGKKREGKEGRMSKKSARLTLLKARKNGKREREGERVFKSRPSLPCASNDVQRK